MARVAALQRLLGLRLKGAVEDEPNVFFGALDELRKEERPLEPWRADQWPQRAAAFTAWLKQHSAPLSASLELRHTSDRGTGVFALQALKEGDPLITVPAALWLTGDDAERAGLSALLPLFCDPLLAASPSVRLALLLMTGGGAWAPYVALLPPSITSPALFSSAAFCRLRSSVSFPSALRAQITAAKQYLHIATLLAQPSLAQSAALLQPFTFARYAWALATVQSRLNPLPDGSVGLIPLWDLCNHSPSLPSSTSATQDQLTFSAPCAVPAGAEVLMNYGPRTVQQLFLTYAFVPHPLPTSPLSIPLSMGLPAGKQRPPPTLVVDLLPDGRTAGAADQVPALHGFPVSTWACNILAAIERAVTPLQASTAEDEWLAAAMLDAEAKLLRGFIEKSNV